MSDARAVGAPTVLRVVLGKRLAVLREKAGLSYEQAARALYVTHATIRRLEKAEVGLKIPYVEKLLRTYGVTDQEEIDGFLALAREANRPGWWHPWRDILPEWFSTFIGLEGEARVIRAYEPHYIPGLLQTEDYARTVLRSGVPRCGAEEVERGVALRVARQRLLTGQDPPQLSVVMDETVLRRPIGGREVMLAQLDRLIEACALPHLRLQVMPFDAGAHPAMYGPFHLFRFQIPELQDIVCSESLVGAVYIDDPQDVALFAGALDRMSAQAAPAERTEDILARMRKEL